MDYFVMRQDKRYTNCIEPLKTREAIEREVVRRGEIQFLDLKTPLLFYIKEKPENAYLDYLESPLPLVSEKLWQLLRQYEKRVFYKPIVLADVKRMRQDYYWLCIPEKLDCLSSKSEFNKDRSLKKIIIDTQRIGYCKLFKIDGVLEDLFIVDLDIAEAILAEDFQGIQFEAIDKE